MRFAPIQHPLVPVVGMLVFQSILVSSLVRDRRRASVAYLGLVSLFELILISLLPATYASSTRGVLFWNSLIMAARLAVCPLWVWIALEMNGIRPARLGYRAVALLLEAPIAVAIFLLFSDPVLHAYWASVTFDGLVLVARRGAASAAFMVYSQALVWVGLILFLVGIPRHFGRERARLIVFFACFMAMFAGDTLWRFGIENPFGINPLSVGVTVGAIGMAVSAFILGHPRVGEPLTRAPFARADAPVARGTAPLKGIDEVFAEVSELSARQREIAGLVVSGTTYRVIAERFGCTERTVKYHMGAILDKCGLETREQLIAWVAFRRSGRS